MFKYGSAPTLPPPYHIISIPTIPIDSSPYFKHKRSSHKLCTDLSAPFAVIDNSTAGILIHINWLGIGWGWGGGDSNICAETPTELQTFTLNMDKQCIPLMDVFVHSHAKHFFTFAMQCPLLVSYGMTRITPLYNMIKNHHKCLNTPNKFFTLCFIGFNRISREKKTFDWALRPWGVVWVLDV